MLSGRLTTEAATFTVATTNDAGPGSLRQALAEANSNPGPDEIIFNITDANPTIHLAAPLPPIEDPVTIDGYTQPGASPNTLATGDDARILIQLVGGVAGSWSWVEEGLSIQASNTTVRGLWIKYFQSAGIAITSGQSNRVEGCFFGVNTDSLTPAKNLYYGVSVESTNTWENLIGGDSPAARNVIAYCRMGILIESSSNNRVEGNFIGTDPAGKRSLGNDTGIYGRGDLGNRFGGANPGAGNLISGNAVGVRISGYSAKSECTNFIQGNWIGTDVTGTNRLGNTDSGIWSSSANSLLIGGMEPGAGNVISGNGYGINVSCNENVTIQGNCIGTDPSGRLDLGNGGYGISLSINDLVGGTELGAGNVIAFNQGEGIRSSGLTFLLRNAIYANARFGIASWYNGELVPNDPGDTGLPQNSPWIADVVADSVQTQIQGTLNSRPNEEYRIEFFGNTECDPSGYGEGQYWLGFITVTTDGQGLAEFSSALPPVRSDARSLTATATSDSRGTSQFSPCARVFDTNTCELKVTQINASSQNSLSSNFTFLIQVTNAGPANATGVTLTDTLPARTSLVSAVPSQGACSLTNGTVTCSLGTISNAGYATVIVVLKPYSAGMTTNRIELATNDEDRHPENNRRVTETLIEGVDLAVGLAVSPNPVIAGQPLTLTLAITNQGVLTASNVYAQFNTYRNEFILTKTYGFTPVYHIPAGSSQGAFFLFLITNLPPGTALELRVTGVFVTDTDDYLFGYVSSQSGLDPFPDNDYTMTTVEVQEGTGIFMFEQEGYWLRGDGNGTTPIRVIRTGGSQGEASVEFTTRDGTALAGSDYITTNGRLRFGPGETSKEFFVQALPGAPGACNKTLLVSLTNCTGGATLLTRTNALLNIGHGDFARVGFVETVSVNSTNPLQQVEGWTPSLSANGRFISFCGKNPKYPWILNDKALLVRDLESHTTTCIDSSTEGLWVGERVLSEDGRYLAYAIQHHFVNVPSTWRSRWAICDLFDGGWWLASSTDYDAAKANGSLYRPTLSQNGAVFAFASDAINLAGIPNPTALLQVYAHNRTNGTTTLVSKSSDGASVGNDASWLAEVSNDGRLIAFHSEADNLVSTDLNHTLDLFVRDLDAGATRLVSVNRDGSASANGPSGGLVTLSADGRYIAFESLATDLIPGNVILRTNIFVRDLMEGITRLISVETSEPTNCFQFTSPRLSADGRYVTFQRLDFSRLHPSTRQPASDILLCDLAANQTVLVSARCSGTVPANGASSNAHLSTDGRYVVFESEATDLVPGKFVPGPNNIYRWDRNTRQTILLTPNHLLNGGSTGRKLLANISADGNVAAFESASTDLVYGDTNSFSRVYVWRANLSLPPLSIAIANNLAYLSWPSFPAGFYLETKTTLDPSVPWEPVEDYIQNDGGILTCVRFFNPLEQTRFYRLRPR